MMSFGGAVRTCLSKYVVWEGRASRAEYWWFNLFNGLAAAVTAVVAIRFPIPGTVLYILSTLGLLLPSLAVTVRRLHDTGRSGWTCWITLIPLLGSIVLLVYLVQAGDLGGNQYGDGAYGARLLAATGQLPQLPQLQPGTNWCENITCRRYRVSSSATVCDQCGVINVNRQTFRVPNL